MSSLMLTLPVGDGISLIHSLALPRIHIAGDSVSLIPSLMVSRTVGDSVSLLSNSLIIRPPLDGSVVGE